MNIDTSLKLRYLSLFNAYPIVDTKSMPNLAMERAKIVIASYMMEKTHSRPSLFFREKMCEIRGLSVDCLPTLNEALRETRVSMDFVTDYSKLQYLYERFPSMRELPEFIIRLA